MAIEDYRFHRHFGLDPMGILRALGKNLRAGRIIEGGSTITQQLAKNLFLTPERTLSRKIPEVLLTLQLEINYSKEDILTMYLNQIYFGHGAYGVETASGIFLVNQPGNSPWLKVPSWPGAPGPAAILPFSIMRLPSPGSI